MGSRWLAVCRVGSSHSAGRGFIETIDLVFERETAEQE